MYVRIARAALAGICAVATLIACSCQMLHHGDEEPQLEDAPLPHKPHIKLDPTMMGLAHDLDKVEKYIDWYGSVVPKVPDVWGQARLTQHREQFETYMATELSAFQVYLNGSLGRSDSAFFAQAVALGIAAQPRPLIGGTTTAPAPSSPTQTVSVQTPPSGGQTS
jgi:hypothetical protein